jgi:hypothetical protein
MNHRRLIVSLVAFVACAGLAAAAAAAPPPSPTKEDRDNYERLIAIIYTGTVENKKAAREALVGMGEVGIALLKEDFTKDPEGVRGALAWKLLREVLPEQRVEEVRAFARKNLLDSARRWNRTYTSTDKADAAVRARLKDLVADYVDLLIGTGDPADFTTLLKSLQFSVILSGDKGGDFGKEFEIWDKIWKLLNDKINETGTIQQLQEWRKIVDGHFRTYSQQKAYVQRKTIQAYHTTDLLFMQRINSLKEAKEKK